jgi:hypothetical protein
MIPGTPFRTAALIVLASTLALTAVLLLVPSASSEAIDVYEIELLTSQYGAQAVAVRGDHQEAVMLWSVHNSTTGTWTNYVLSTTGVGVTERSKYSGQNWRWMVCEYDPDSNIALLGGTRGMLYTYNSGTIAVVSTPFSYDIRSIDWHPTANYALIGTQSSQVWRYRSGSVSSVFSVSYRSEDMDFRPDGSEVAISCYRYLYIVNTSSWSAMSYQNPDGEGEYYYIHTVEYSPDGTYVLTDWRSRNGGHALYSFKGGKWNKVSTVIGQPIRMEFETESSFVLIGTTNNLVYSSEGQSSTVGGWFDLGGGIANDVSWNHPEFYCLVGGDGFIGKLKRKPNVKPWLSQEIQEFSFDEDEPNGGDNLIDLGDFVQDDRSFDKLRFEFEDQQDPTLLEGRIDGQFLDFIQKKPNWNGKMYFVLKIWDRGDDDIEGSLDDLFNRTNLFNVTVRPVNDPIDLLKVGDKVVGQDDLVYFLDESEWLNLTLDYYDVDEDVPKFSLNVSIPSLKVRLVEDEYVLTFQPRNKDVGTLYLNLTVTDEKGSFDYANMVYHVRNMNNPPRLKGVNDKTVLEDQWLNFTVWAKDEDLDIGIPDVISFSTNRTDGIGDDDLVDFIIKIAEDPTYINIAFLPTNDDVGEVLVEFRVRDGFAPAGTWQDVKTMVIPVVNTNDAPKLIEINGLSIENLEEYSLNAVEDEELSVSFLAEDDDGDPLTYYVDDLRFELEQTFGEVDSILTFVPVNEDVGTVTVVMSVWDTHNSFDELVLNVTVQNINDPPVIAVFEADDATSLDELEFTLYEDILFTAPVMVLDVDSDDVVFKDSEGLFTFTVDPLNPFRAIANYTPGQDVIGTLETTIEVDDRDGGRDFLNLVLIVVGTNDPPGKSTVSQPAPGESMTIQVLATRVSDPDDDPLTYTWDFGDKTAPVSGENLTDVTHAYPRSGIYPLVLTVSDGRGGFSVTEFDVIVPSVEEDTDPVEVEEGPVLLVVLLTVIILVVAVVMVYLYYTHPGKGAGGGT